jgi:carboxypeptidase Taq
MIGYFPTYTLGNLMAAQLWRALSDDLTALDNEIAAGDFHSLREWLREHIHRHGRKFDSRELLRRATGEELSVEPWLAYLEGKLLDAGLLLAPVRAPRS